MQGTHGRWVHLATVQDGIREYICFFDIHDQKMYIEEITNGSLEFISDDSVVRELADFLLGKNVTNLTYGLPIPD